MGGCEGTSWVRGTLVAPAPEQGSSLDSGWLSAEEALVKTAGGPQWPRFWVSAVVTRATGFLSGESCWDSPAGLFLCRR